MKLNQAEFKRLEAIAQTILRLKNGEPENDSGLRVIDFRLTEVGIEISASDPEGNQSGKILSKTTLAWAELDKIFP